MGIGGRSTRALAGQAIAVSADDAQQAIAQGAFVVDVRESADFVAGHLPQASSVPRDLASQPLQAVASHLSQAGIDTSRTVLIMGDAGDLQAQALWQRLSQVASGRVLWLVGGVQEWQLTGRALSTEVIQRLPVPQFLTPFDAANAATRMAGSKVRSGRLLEQNLSLAVDL